MMDLLLLLLLLAPFSILYVFHINTWLIHNNRLSLLTLSLSLAHPFYTCSSGGDGGRERRVDI